MLRARLATAAVREPTSPQEDLWRVSTRSQAPVRILAAVKTAAGALVLQAQTALVPLALKGPLMVRTLRAETQRRA